MIKPRFLRPINYHHRDVFFELSAHIDQARSLRCFVSCGKALSTGCGCELHSSFGCVPPLDTSPLASGGRPPTQALTLFGGVGFIARRLRRPEKGNADGVRGIFGTACRVGLRPCDRTYLKNSLVVHLYAGWA